VSTPNRFTVQTWEEADEIIREIEKENSESLTGVWFRGLARANWLLTTTLERRRKESFSVSEYYCLMRKTLPAVESFTGQRWDQKALEWSDPKTGFAEHFRASPAFSYMAHLRHNGFPSPLLDWSRSPYVAAYFAFAGAEPTPGENVAIFAYSETPNNGKTTSTRRPQICTHGGFGLRTHVRHFRQQSCYTVCVEYLVSDNHSPVLDSEWRFVRHQQVFESMDQDQDRLYKIKIPSTERSKVLRLLERFNLNHFTLFGSEESLMEALASQWIDGSIDLHPLSV
jgi:hypothetical protein